VGVSDKQASTNRLTVTVHVVLKKTLDNKEQEFDVSRNFDFSANLSLSQAEAQLMEDIVRNISDDIFNQIFQIGSEYEGRSITKLADTVDRRNQF